MEELNNFNQINFGLGMFMHQLISGPMFGISILLLISSLFRNSQINEIMKTKFLPVFIIFFSISLVSGLSLDLGLDFYWQNTVLEKLSNYRFGKSSIVGFFIINFVVFILMKFDVKKNRLVLLFFLMSIGCLLLFLWSFIVNTIIQKPSLINLEANTLDLEVNLYSILKDKYFLYRILHYLNASIMQAIFIFLIGASIILKNNNINLIKKIFFSLVVAGFISLAIQLFSGHISIKNLSEIQPTKLSASLGVYKSNNQVDLYIFGFTNDKNKKNKGLKIPTKLSNKMTKDIKFSPLDDFKSDEIPNIKVVFQSFHLMIFCWILIFIFFSYSFINYILNFPSLKTSFIVVFFIISIVASQSGWVFSETGRKPWLFYNVIMYSQTNIKPFFHLLLTNFVLQIVLIYILSKLVVKNFNAS